MISSFPYREALVTTLIHDGAIHSQSVSHAFLHTPREAFVPAYYKEWEHLVRVGNIPDEEYLEDVYANQSLVTKINEKGRPTSSSSLPAVMAKMLEALAVMPDQRVLEIGTGTGYNAALLSQLAGDPTLVTSIEYDEELGHQAAERIEQVCPGVTVVIGDGAQGYAAHAPYDRIIATVSAPTVPLAWLEQLAPGGKIVMDLQGSMQVSGFLIVEKTQEEEIVGHFKEEPLHFMPMMDPPGTNTISAASTQEWNTKKDKPFPAHFDNTDFKWWLQWAQPGTRLRRMSQRGSDDSTLHFLFCILPNGTGVRFQPVEETWHVKVYGERAYEVLSLAYQDFLTAGEPSPKDSILLIQEDLPLLSISGYHFPI